MRWGAHSIIGETKHPSWVVPDLLNPYDARLMRCDPVSTRLNSVANDDGRMPRSGRTTRDSGSAFLIVETHWRKRNSLSVVIAFVHLA
jgi:hypothetical protein